jgi:hypothetical protein
MIQEYLIEDAYVGYCNGEGSEKQLVLDVSYDAEVVGCAFRGRLEFLLPVKSDTPIGDRDDLIGKKLGIMIQ